MATLASDSTRPEIRIETRYYPSEDPSLPALAAQAICLVDSYMVWVGVADEPDRSAPKAVFHGNLCKDWACAMPANKSPVPAAATSLFRSASSDVGLSMSQRLARRFKKQIFLSIDVPPSFLSLGQGPNIALLAEKKAVALLTELESAVRL